MLLTEEFEKWIRSTEALRRSISEINPTAANASRQFDRLRRGVDESGRSYFGAATKADLMSAAVRASADAMKYAAVTHLKWTDAVRAETRNTALYQAQLTRNNEAIARLAQLQHSVAINTGMTGEAAAKFASQMEASYKLAGEGVDDAYDRMLRTTQLMQRAGAGTEDILKLHKSLKLTLRMTDSEIAELFNTVTSHTTAWGVSVQSGIDKIIDTVGTAATLDGEAQQAFFKRQLAGLATLERSSKTFKGAVDSMTATRGQEAGDQTAYFAALANVSIEEAYSLRQRARSNDGDVAREATRSMASMLAESLTKRGIISESELGMIQKSLRGEVFDAGDSAIRLDYLEGVLDDLMKQAGLSLKDAFEIAAEDTAPLGTSAADFKRSLDAASESLEAFRDAMRATATTEEEAQRWNAKAAATASSIMDNLVGWVSKAFGVSPDAVKESTRSLAGLSQSDSGQAVTGAASTGVAGIIAYLFGRGQRRMIESAAGAAGAGGGASMMARAMALLKSPAAMAKASPYALLAGGSIYGAGRSAFDQEALLKEGKDQASGGLGYWRSMSLLNLPKELFSLVPRLGVMLRENRRLRGEANEGELRLDDALMKSEMVKAVIESERLGSPITPDMALAQMISEKATKGTFSAESALVSLLGKSSEKLAGAVQVATKDRQAPASKPESNPIEDLLNTVDEIKEALLTAVRMKSAFSD